jgi:2-desacetyl-2-hydroxyethyl bacteriochlorophyllide A dehydrogenase
VPDPDLAADVTTRPYATVAALRYSGDGQLAIRRLRVKKPEPNDVLVRPVAVGVCGTDIHIINGHFPSRPPVVLGHEIAAIVDIVGSNVSHIRSGDLVTIEPHRYCRACRYCRSGREHLCIEKLAYGVHLDGGLAEAMTVPAANAYLLPPGTPPDIGCLVEPLACAVHGMERLAPVAGYSALVFGAGVAGCLLVALARLHGLSPVVVVEPREERRARAITFGADAVFDPNVEGWLDSARELTDDGFDRVIDAVGSADLLGLGLRASARGARILAYGVADPADVLPVRPYELFARELSIVGSVINPYTHQQAVDLLPRMALERLGIAPFALSDFRQALDGHIAGRFGKVVIRPQADREWVAKEDED